MERKPADQFAVPVGFTVSGCADLKDVASILQVMISGRRHGGMCVCVRAHAYARKRDLV